MVTEPRPESLWYCVAPCSVNALSRVVCVRAAPPSKAERSWVGSTPAAAAPKGVALAATGVGGSRGSIASAMYAAGAVSAGRVALVQTATHGDFM